jgi:uroporphyrinogen-III synthase
VPESTAASPALAGVRVLITRPREQAENLARLIEAEGGEAIRFPVIEITDPQNSRALFATIDRLEAFDIAIFISPNAVNRAMNLILARRGGLPPGLRLACVGRGSARELKHFGVEQAIVPPGRFDSEALLELPALREVAGARIVIFRGDGGRELLGDTLAARGATVEYAECYRRTLPAADATPLLRRWARGEVNIVTVTSVEGLRNLYEMLGSAGQAWLIRTPIVVVSERMAAVCRELGFKTEPLVAARAADEALLEAVKAWRAAQKTL